MNNNNVFEVRSLLQNAQSVLIALSTANDEDIVAAGLGLYLTLSKMKKHYGPMLRLKEHVTQFNKIHKKTFVEKGRICTYLEREFYCHHTEHREYRKIRWKAQ